MANVCYHHFNLLDRPAVANCNACGKSLCQECADKFRSRKTGKALCVDCFNYQLRQESAKFATYAKEHKKKSTIMIICGSIFGALPILLGIFALLAALFTFDGENFVMGIVCLLVGAWMGSAATSIAKLFSFAHKIANIAGPLWPLRLVLFIAGFIVAFAVSPIIFAVNLINHIKDTKKFNRFAYLNSKLITANQEFLAKARALKSGSMDSAKTIALQNEINALNKKLQDAKSQAEKGASSIDMAQIQAMIDAKVQEERRAREEDQKEYAKQFAEEAKQREALMSDYENLKSDMAFLDASIQKNIA